MHKRQRYVGDVYIQHNPALADGKDAFVEILHPQGAGAPREAAELKRVLVAGVAVDRGVL